ncbi:exopolysaccharide biosynthesis polyprenyl glycosylphosphotransferase [Ilumatobacter sp.]|uniref:exopolysaccharide biosynthesis polyprenyl glycosylphosphotransferase n=1 Tax=Ilumatobacter sp. TaxID=1967498 RepID=UPI003C728986
MDIESRPAEMPVEDASMARGPLRPDRLVSVRQRQDRRLAAHRFRAVDTIFLFGITVYFLQHFADRSVFEIPLAEVIPVAAGAWSIWFLPSALGLYRFGRSELLVAHFGRLMSAVLVGVAVTVLAHWIVPTPRSGATDMLRFGALCGAGLTMLHATWWCLVVRWRSLGLLTPNIVVVGATHDAEGLISTAIDRRDMNILGVFDDRAERSPLAMLGVPVLGTTESMLRHRIMPYVDLIVVTIDQSAAARVRQIMGRLAVLPNPVTLLFDETADNRRAAAIEQIADAPLAPLHPATDGDRKAFAKRLQDLVIGVIALVLFAPVMGLIALAIRLDSSGPVFFRQRRQGFNNEEFSVWKFRTMRHEAADPKAVRQVTADDDRVTRVGHILRKTSLDELPQLFNVAVGEMSLVGPRPHAVGMKTGDVESAELVAEYAHRHRIKPGMTGWAAINGSRGPLHEPEEVGRRVALDVGYIERQSVWLDLQIMVRTIPSMLGDRAAVR